MPLRCQAVEAVWLAAALHAYSRVRRILLDMPHAFLSRHPRPCLPSGLLRVTFSDGDVYQWNKVGGVGILMHQSAFQAVGAGLIDIESAALCTAGSPGPASCVSSNKSPAVNRPPPGLHPLQLFIRPCRSPPPSTT